MARIFKGIRGVIVLAVVAFVLLVIFGLYTALDAAPSYTLASSDGTTAAERLASDSPAITNNSVSSGSEIVGVSDAGGAGQAQSDDGSSPVALSSEGNSTAATTNSSVPTVGTGNTGNGSSSNGGSGSSSNGGGTAPAPSNPPSASTPQPVYHEPWDEWITEGHWEDRAIPATYGERPVYGSVCSECGANISGHASAHLKETHHSGYYEGVVGSETYEITPARTVSEWVDTSHWVHHEGYWE